MFKNKVLFIVSAILSLSMLIALACAPSAPPTPPTPPISTPSQTTPQVPTTPATLTPTAEQPTSFDAATYTNDEVGFSMKYPRNWVKNELKGTEVLYATANNKPDFDAVSVLVMPAATNFVEAIKKQMTAAGRIVDIKIESTKSTTLVGGQTPAYEVIITGYGPSVLKQDKYCHCFGTDKGGKTIAIFASTENIEGHKALVQEIARTLRLK